MAAGEHWQACNAAERDVLYSLRVEEPMTGSDIAHATGRSPATVSRALRSLAESGLVARDTPSEFPAPQKENRLTDQGRSVTTAAFDAYREAL